MLNKHTMNITFWQMVMVGLTMLCGLTLVYKTEQENKSKRYYNFTRGVECFFEGFFILCLPVESTSVDSYSNVWD